MQVAMTDQMKLRNVKAGIRHRSSRIGHENEDLKKEL